MRAQALDTGAFFKPAENLTDGSVSNGPKIGHKEKTIGGSTAGTAGHIPEKDFAGGQAKRGNPLLVTLAVHDQISFRDMDMVDSKGDYLMKTKANVKHEGADTEIAELDKIPGVKAGKKDPNFRISENINCLSLSLGKAEFFRKVVRYVLLLVTPSKKGPQSTYIGLSGNRGNISLRKGQIIAFKAV